MQCVEWLYCMQVRTVEQKAGFARGNLHQRKNDRKGFDMQIKNAEVDKMTKGNANREERMQQDILDCFLRPVPFYTFCC